MRGHCERFLTRYTTRGTAVEQVFQQLVILLKGDVPVVSALETVAELAKGSLAKALKETADSVRGGLGLAKSLELTLPWIGRLYLGLIAVGESNGTLPQMFQYASEIMARRRKLKNEVIRAMTYPAIVVLMGLAVGYYVSAIAIPKIASVMGDPSKLPDVTKSLLDFSAWIKVNGYWIVLAPALVFAALHLIGKIGAVGTLLDRVSLSVPIFGKVGRFASNALFAHTMALLLRSGVSVVDGLALVQGTVENRWYRHELKSARQQVTGGRLLSASLQSTDLRRLTPMAVALIRVGESSGNMDEGLAYVGDYYAQELAKRLDLMGKLIEPALIVVVGGMVAFVYIAFFMGMAAVNAAGI